MARLFSEFGDAVLQDTDLGLVERFTILLDGERALESLVP